MGLHHPDPVDVVRRDIERLVEDLKAFPKLDVTEDESAVHVAAELPGLGASEFEGVHAVFDRGVLKVDLDKPGARKAASGRRGWWDDRAEFFRLAPWTF
jgi:HSP20 family molecular chaperone IbpA